MNNNNLINTLENKKMLVNNKRLVDTFMELVRIDSESKNEGKFQEFLGNKFKELGLSVYEDDTKKITGLGSGNLLCVLEANSDLESLMFCCHSDTVAPGVGIEPVIKNGNIYSKGDTILAADDKAGIAVLIEMIKKIQEENLSHGKIELLFTPGEEIGLLGADAFDTEKLDSKYGYIFDSAGPVGGILMASPTLYSIKASFKGISAHAGVEPEKGISAIEMAAKSIAQMKLGRIDEITTANIGTINGGIATNVVPDSTTLTAEVRSISEDRCYEIIKEMTNIMENISAELEGSVEITLNKLSTGYKLEEDSYVVKLAKEAFDASNINIDYQISGGASDANIFNARGIETANLAVGYEKIHTTSEFIPIIEMEKALDVALYLTGNNKK